MPYMLAPGARLYVGPHGQMEESLGSCCAPCATGLGATASLATSRTALQTMAAALPMKAGVTIGTSAMPSIPGGGMSPLVIGVAVGAAALGVFYIVKRRKR